MQKISFFHIAKQIQRQVFGTRKTQVYLFEKFQLSEQYTPEKLWDLYEDSVLMELEAYSPYKRSIMKNAKVEFPDEHNMRVTVSDQVYDKEAVDDILRILDRVFNERCGFQVKVDVNYVDLKEHKSLEKSEAQMRQRISFLTESLMKEKEAKAEAKAERKAAREEAKAAGVSGGKSSGNSAGAASSAGGSAPIEKDTGSFGGKKSFGGGRFGGEGRSGSIRRSDNPDVLYGRDFEDEPIPLEQIVEEMGEVTIRGKILNMEEREIRGERTIVTLTVSDFTDTIHIKMFTRNEQLEELRSKISAGGFVKLKGMTTLDRFDHELTISSVVGIKKIADFTTSRMDYSYKKRVELHCHTKMSDMDGVTDASVLLKRAKAWGMPALAITDHGCVQAFTEASHTISKDEDFKVIYGVEGYLVDDLKELVENSKGQSLDDPYVVFDLETTDFPRSTIRSLRSVRSRWKMERSPTGSALLSIRRSPFPLKSKN